MLNTDPPGHQRLRAPGPVPTASWDYTQLFFSGDWVVWDAQPVPGTTSYAAAYRIGTARTTQLSIPGSAEALSDGLLAWVDGTSGILMSFDDYAEGLDRFGQEVVPLLDFELEHLDPGRDFAG